MIGNFIERNRFYRNFAQLLDAGIPIDQALTSLIPKARSGFGSGARAAQTAKIQQLVVRARRGDSLARAMHDFPKLDSALIKVGEQTGNLPETLRFLSTYYEDQDSLLRSLRGAMVQPGILFLTSLFLRDFPALFSGQMGLAVYLLRALGPLSLVGLFVFGIFHTLAKSTDSQALAGRLWSLARPIPWLGNRMLAAQMEKFFLCLDLCFRAGCDLNLAMEIASSLVISPQLKTAITQTRVRQEKLGFAKALESTGMFREAHIAEIRTAEISGNLDAAFARLSRELRTETVTALDQFKQYAPRVLYAIAAIYVGSGIIKSMSALPPLPE